MDFRRILTFVLTLALIFSSIGIYGVSAFAETPDDKAIKNVRVGYYLAGEDFQAGKNDSERKHGYAYEYYQEVAKYSGWTYEYVYGSYSDIHDKLLSDEIDIMAGVTKTKESESLMLFPDNAMGSEIYYIFAPASDYGINSLDTSALDGARIGVKSNSVMRALVEKFAHENDFECEILEYDTLEGRIRAYESGDLDFIVTVETDMLTGFRPAYNLGESDFYFAVNKNRPDLIDDLNYAQTEIRANFPNFISNLRIKYFMGNDSQGELSSVELQWLKQHGTIKVGYLSDYMPYCDYDEESGSEIGLLSVLVDQLKTFTEADVKTKCYKKYADLVSDLEAGDIDIIFPTFSDLWYSENQNYMQSVDVTTSRMCVVYKNDYNNKIYDRIAVSSGSPLQSYYLTVNYPEAEQVTYDGWSECLNAIQNGEVGCMLVNSELIYRYLNEHKEFSKLQLAELESEARFCCAVSRNERTLFSIVNKMLNGISDTAITDTLILNSYVEPTFSIWDYISEHIVFFVTFAVIFVAIIIALVSFYISRIKRDKAELEAAYNRELEFIEEQKKTQVAIYDAYEAAKRANNAKSDFLSRMSHDIRTPMNAIIGMTTIANIHKNEPDRVEDCLNKINTSGKHLLNLINEVLDLSKIESGRLTSSEDNFNINDFIDNTITLVAAQAEEKKQKIIVSTENITHFDVIGDDSHIQQVFVNILGNAIKYTGEGGTIKFSAVEKLVDKPTIACYDFIFEDNGIGISEDFLEHIFEPFSREKDGKDTDAHGTGLGLSIVYNIVNMLGGVITVKSEQGVGSVFTVTLQLRVQNKVIETEDRDVSDEVEKIESNCFAGKRVLLVEDNELNSEIAEELLKLSEIEVEHAWNGEEAVAMLDRNEPGHYDLVLMDIQMPVMNGYEAARAIRSSERDDLKHIPIIATTANAFSDDIKAALEAGMNSHIPKPIDINRLLTVLKKYF